ncbi:MAG: ABC transporter substrate-binding protein, partial [Acidobacteriota bacterium]|nr:ABC transporter substrate-binding protein [Acidobacteriota bacterium]
EIPFVSASFSHLLGDPAQAPYNFLVGTSYTDQFRILLDWILEQEGGAPEHVGILHMPSPAGLSPIVQGGREYAESLGISLEVHEMPRGGTDYSAEITRVVESGARHVFFHHSAGAAALALRNAHSLGVELVTACLNYCTNEIVVELAGEAAEGLLGAMIFAPPGEGVAGLDAAADYLAAKGQSLKERGLLYGQGWTQSSILMEGVRRAAATGEVSGRRVHAELENLRSFDTGGVTVPVSFTAEDHRGIRGMRIFQVQGGAWKPLSGQRTVSGGSVAGSD